MKGDNRRQWRKRKKNHFRAQEADHANQHPPHMKGDNRRQPETTGDKTTSEPKMAAKPTNTHPPHEGRHPETTGDKTTSEPKKPTTPTTTHPHMKGDNRRQWETTGPKKPTTPTNTHPYMKGDNRRQWETTGRQDHFRAQEADHTNQHQGGQI